MYRCSYVQVAVTL